MIIITLFRNSYWLVFVLYGIHVVFMLLVCIYLYWCPIRCPYHITFVLFSSNTTGVTCGAETTNHSTGFEFTLVFCGIRADRSLVFCVMFYVSLFVLLSFFDHCLSFFDVRILITPLVSSTFSRRITE